MLPTGLSQLWEEHTRHEFATRDTEETLATMVEDAYVNHVPVLTGGSGKSALREFYSRDFIPNMPPDTTLTPISRTVGTDQLVDEMIFSFTHTQEMPWMLPGIPPTNRHVEVALVAIVRFRAASSPTSTSTGIRRPCLSSLDCSPIPAFPSAEPNRPARCAPAEGPPQHRRTEDRAGPHPRSSRSRTSLFSSRRHHAR
jgi:hypothetical protein